MGRHFLFRARTDGGHVRVSVWAGTAVQKTTGGRPNLGELCMLPEDWATFRAMVLLAIVANPTRVTIEDQTRGPR